MSYIFSKQATSAVLRASSFAVVCLFILGLTPNVGTAQEDFRKVAPTAGAAPKIELGKFEHTTLKNGLQVIVVENHKLPTISVQLFVDHPPIQQGDNVGYASMAGSMLSRGTKTRTKAELDEAIDFIGASFNTSSSGMYGSALVKHKATLMDLMTDVLYNPTFPDIELDKLKKQAISALASSKDDPNTIAANVGAMLRNGKNHPYGEVETEATLKSITVDLCRQYFNTWFAPNISYLIIVGDVKTADAKLMAEQYFGKWAKKSVPAVKLEAPKLPKRTEVDFVNKEGAVQSVINITYPIDLLPSSPDVIPVSVMRTVLGGYFGSRLNENLRESKAYTYGARASLNPDETIGNFNANASVRNAVTDSSLVQFFYEMEMLRNQAIPGDELRMVKNYMTGGFARSLEDPQTIARFALNTFRYKLPQNYYATYLQTLDKVNERDVLEMAQKYLLTDNAYVLVVGNKDEVAEKLIPFSATGEINYYDNEGTRIVIDDLPTTKGLTGEQIVNEYLQAVGSKEKIMEIKTFQTVANTTVQGMTLDWKVFKKDNNKMRIGISMAGNVVGKTIFNNGRGMNFQGENATPLDGMELDELATEAYPVPEFNYAKMGVKMELKGTDLVNEQQAYKVLFTFPSGRKQTAYYDRTTHLKVREISAKGEGENMQTQTMDYANYKTVAGVQYPHTITVNGIFPIPLELNVTDVKINQEMDDNLFQLK